MSLTTVCEPQAHSPSTVAGGPSPVGWGHIAGRPSRQLYDLCAALLTNPLRSCAQGRRRRQEQAPPFCKSSLMAPTSQSPLSWRLTVCPKSRPVY